MGINNKRLLRVINQQINEYKTQNGEGSVVGFPSVINEEFVDVLTPKVSDNIAAIQTSVKPWVFVCNKSTTNFPHSLQTTKRREALIYKD
jgi:type II secretory pathway pseudopilin PulG